MESSLLASALRNTEAALRGLATSLPDGPVPPGLLLTPLARIGDALRLGLEIPAPIRRWAAGVSQPDLGAALGSLIDETASWSLPDRDTVLAEGDPFLALAVRRRDETESVRHGVRRLCLPRGIEPRDITEFAALTTVLILIDDTMKTLLSRTSVMRLLGYRAAMQPTWADAFDDEADGDAQADVTGEDRWREAVQQAIPSDEVIAHYVGRGALARYVEGVAAVNDNFVEDLAACIDAMIQCGEGVGLVARRWRKRALVDAAVDPLLFAAIPAARFAAATAPDVDVPETELRLGALSPLDAELRIVVTATGVTVQVTAGEQGLERIELGKAVATVPTEADYWELVLSPIPTGPVKLLVRAADGTEFAEELRFNPVVASNEGQ